MPAFDGQPRILRPRPGLGVGTASPGTVIGTAPGGGSALGPAELIVPTQDGSNPRLWTIPGVATWIPSTIRLYWQGQRLQTPLITFSGPGNRTIMLDASVGIALGDYLEGDGVTE